MDTKTMAATPWPTQGASTVPPRMDCPASREAQEPPHGERTNVGRAHDDPGYAGELKRRNPENVPNEGTRHELLAAVLDCPSQQGARRELSWAVTLQVNSPVDPLAGFHVTVRK